MILKQYYLGCLSQASYLIGDERTREAVVVDPRRDVEPYVEDARRLGLTLRHVFLTHFHADFVSGHLELAARTGCSIHVGARGRTGYPSVPARDGDVLELGSVRLEILETPGHTPESISIVVHDLAGGAPRPHAVLTGDALFLGDVGRPDLLVSVGLTAQELAGMLYDSLREKLLPLPDDVLVYPAHGAGSACGKNLSKETFATLGSQKAANWALQPMSKERFVRELTADLPAAPGYFAWDAEYNRRERPVLEQVLAEARKRLSLADVLRHQAAGAIVLDVREPDDYAAGHLIGSVNVGLSGRFAGWVGTVLPRDAPLIVLSDPGREDEALTRLGRIGFDHVLGLVEGGPAALREHVARCASHPRVDSPELARQLAARPALLVLDVRAAGEWESGHIPGCLNVPLDQLERRIADVPREHPIVVQCQGGYRSSIAASLLERSGLRVHADLRGGFAAWHGCGLPTRVPAAG